MEYYTFTNQLWKDETFIRETTEPFVLPYTFPQELETLLYYNRLIIEQMYGNFDKSTFQENCPLIVCICRKKEYISN